MVVADGTLSRLLKLLSDPTRLRMLGLLERQELSVGELSRCLGMAQSRVSNHLRLLRELDLLAERHAGTSTYLQMAKPHGADGLPTRLWRLWTALSGELATVPEHAADLVRLSNVLADRRGRGEEFFDRLAGEWDKLAGEFESGIARHRAAAHLLPRDFVVADLGCGTGYMAHALLGQCTRMICVDSSQGMLDEARRRLMDHPGDSELEFRRGELDDLPIETGELDGLVAGMVLHHLTDLERPLAEFARVLKPGGTAVVLELAPHREAWMRTELGDRHLGLAPGDVLAAFGRAGFEDIALDPLQDRYRPRRPSLASLNGSESHAGEVSLSLYLVRGRAPKS